MGAQLRAPCKPIDTIMLPGIAVGPSIRHPLCRDTSVSRRAVRLIVVVFPLWPATYDGNVRYATCAAVTPLVLQLRHLCCSYATCVSVTPLLLQLCHLCCSYATCAAVTPLVLLLLHLCCSYATCAAVTPLVLLTLIRTLYFTLIHSYNLRN